MAAKQDHDKLMVTAAAAEPVEIKVTESSQILALAFAGQREKGVFELYREQNIVPANKTWQVGLVTSQEYQEQCR